MNGYKELIQKEQQALGRVFSHYLPSSFIPANAVIFWCGILNEQEVLFDLYGTRVRGFDNDPQMITMSQSADRSTILADLSTGIALIDSSIDLLVGRNLPINPHRSYHLDKTHDEWKLFLSKAYQKATYPHHLFMTFALDDEYFIGSDILSQLPYDIVVAEPNVFNVPSDRIGIVGAPTKDDYVILAKASSQQELFFM